MAVEAREARRQELLEKIAEGQAAKKQKLEQEAGAGGAREAAAGQAQEGQASGEQEEAGERGPDPGECSVGAGDRA